MRIGRVTGNVVSVVKEPTHAGKKLLIVSFLDGRGELLDEEYIYADAAGAGVGDMVLVSEDGTAAELEFEHDEICSHDGVIVGVVDGVFTEQMNYKF